MEEKTVIIETLLKGTKHKIFVCSLPNAKDAGNPHDLYTRDRAKIDAFIKKEDVPGRGVFYCVSTVEGKRNVANARETAFIHADVDFKDVGAVIDGLKKLELPPSWVVMSGHGMHLYWALHEPTTEDVTDILKNVCGIVCGDAAVTHRAALMRMPGTTNSKGDPIPVTCSRDTGHRYTLEDLRAWRQGPVLRRKGEVALTDEERAELAGLEAFASEYKPRIDVESRLAGMEYQGAGDSSVHATQLHVTAALMTRGGDIDEVVERVLDATKAAVGSVAWNWGVEERSIRRMCESFVVKKLSAVQSTTDNVVSITEGKKAKKDKGDEDETPLHIALTQGFWKALAAQNQRLLLVGQRMWHYKDGMWREIGDDKAWLNRTLNRGCGIMKVSPTIRLIAEARENIMREVEYVADREWDVHGLIATQSGLVDLETGEVRPAEADDYVTHMIECEYDPAAKCPNWLRMLSDVTEGMDPKTIDVLQEIAGVTLVENKPKALRKAFVAVGPSNSGKSNVINVLSGLCSDGVIATEFDAMSGSHGLSEFTQRRPWVVHEAFNISKWHISSNVKAIISGEPITVNQKNKAPVTLRYRMPVFWGGNTSPKFKEETKAIANRVIIMQFLRIFEKLSGVALDAIKAGYETPADWVLNTEKAGLLNWAMAGARRALKRGRFEETSAMTASVDAMHENAVLVGSFVAECVERGVEGHLMHADFCGAFAAYFAESRGSGQACPGNQVIGASISESGVLKDAKRRLADGIKYEGVHLNELGLAYWQTCRNATTTSLVNRQTRMSPDAESVNRGVVRRR